MTTAKPVFIDYPMFTGRQPTAQRVHQCHAIPGAASLLKERVADRMRRKSIAAVARDHADLFPDAPVNCRHRVALFGVPCIGPCIQEAVCSHVIDLTLRRDERAVRREQQHEIERCVTQRFFEHHGAIHFGREYFLDIALTLQLNQFVADHACSVKYTVERTKVCADFGDDFVHAIGNGDIACQRQNHAAQRFKLPHPLNCPADAVVRGMTRKPVVASLR